MRCRGVGKLRAAGRGTRCDNGELRALDVKVVDRVLFAKRSSTEIKNGRDFVVAKESDIMGVVE